MKRPIEAAKMGVLHPSIDLENMNIAVRSSYSFKNEYFVDTDFSLHYSPYATLALWEVRWFSI
jgi:hypothetical protein